MADLYTLLIHRNIEGQTELPSPLAHLFQSPHTLPVMLSEYYCRYWQILRNPPGSFISESDAREWIMMFRERWVQLSLSTKYPS
jgi:hypothetical protein